MRLAPSRCLCFAHREPASWHGAAAQARPAAGLLHACYASATAYLHHYCCTARRRPTQLHACHRLFPTSIFATPRRPQEANNELFSLTEQLAAAQGALAERGAALAAAQAAAAELAAREEELLHQLQLASLAGQQEVAARERTIQQLQVGSSGCGGSAVVRACVWRVARGHTLVLPRGVAGPNGKCLLFR